MCKIFYDMVRITKNPCQLNEKNCKRYLDGCKKIISRSIETELRELGAEICESIRTIIKYAFSNDQDASNSEICRKLLSIFARPNFCKSLVMHNHDTCFKFIEELHCYIENIPVELINSAQELIKQAFDNEDSILYSHITFETRCSEEKITFTELILKDLNFIVSEFAPLVPITWNQDLMSNKKFEKFFELNTLILDTHLENVQKDNEERLFKFFNMWFGVDHNALLNVISYNDLSKEDSIACVKQINSFWSYLLPFIGRANFEYQFFKRDYTILEGSYPIDISVENHLAHYIYLFINRVSLINCDDTKTEHMLLSILCNPYYEPNETTSNILTKVKDKILENLDAYMIRALLNTFGLVKWGAYGKCPWAKELHTMGHL